MRASGRLLAAGSLVVGSLALATSGAAPPAALAAPASVPSGAPAAGPGPAGSQAFAQGGKALAAGDLPAALAQLEAALAADPDNLRYASVYRHAIIKAGEYDRALAFFEKLVAEHPAAPFAWLNYGYVFVDKMPAAGAITQVILANDALKQFTRSIELKASWIALYTRGNSYLYWPKIFGRAPLAVADLERAVAISKSEPKRAYQAHAYAALGDAYWQTDQPERARATWQDGARLFPQDAGLEARLRLKGDELEAYIADQLDRTKRVDTDLHELWEDK